MSEARIISLLALSFATVLNAERPAEGTAGCGLGSIVLDRKSQVVAASTNFSGFNQMFGITSGTSRCPGAGALAKNLPAFVEPNRLALETDVSRGRGETLSSLSQILGCDGTETLGATLKENYERIFGSPVTTSSSVASTIIEIVETDPDLADECTSVRT